MRDFRNNINRKIECWIRTFVSCTALEKEGLLKVHNIELKGRIIS